MALVIEFATEELIRVCIDRQVEEGEEAMRGIVALLMMAGYLMIMIKHTSVLALREWILLGLFMVEGDLIGMRMWGRGSTPGVQKDARCFLS